MEAVSLNSVNTEKRPHSHLQNKQRKQYTHTGLRRHTIRQCSVCYSLYVYKQKEASNKANANKKMGTSGIYSSDEEKDDKLEKEGFRAKDAIRT